MVIHSNVIHVHVIDPYDIIIRCMHMNEFNALPGILIRVTLTLV